MIHITLACEAASFQIGFFRRFIGTDICLVLFALASNRRYRKQMLIGESIGLVIALLIYLGQRTAINGLWGQIMQGWFLNHWEVVLDYDEKCFYVNLLLMTFLSGLGWWGHEKPLRHGLLTIEVVGLIISMTASQMALSKCVMSCFLCYVLIALTKVMFLLRYGKQGLPYCREMLIYLVPFYLLFGVICIKLPKKETPLQWKWLTSIENEMSHIGKQLEATRLYELFWQQFQDLEDYVDEKGEAYDIPFAQLDLGLDNERLDFEDRRFAGEPIQFTDEELFSIEVDKEIKQVIYLAGDEKAYYEGSAWMHETEERKMINDPAYDAMETIYGLAHFGADHWQNMIMPKTLRVHYSKINTRLLFYPRSTWQIADQKPFEIQQSKSGRMEWMIRTDQERSYTALYYEINSESRLFRSWMMALDHFSYLEDQTDVIAYANEQGFILPDLFKGMSNDEIRSTLWLRAEENKKRYVQLPEDFPVRIQHLAAEITEGAGTDYEKVMLLAQYLKSGSYTYTRTPGFVPDDQDFVDYFLFTSPSGYCSHYASALVLMARSIGIPARYVEGYAISPSVKKTCAVKDSFAHAWAEIYREGFGWIPVEATPAGYVTRNEEEGEDIVAPEEDIVAPQEVQEAYDTIKEEEALQKEEETPIEEITSTQESESLQPEITPSPSEEAAEQQEEETQKHSSFSPLYSVLGGALFVLLIGGLLLGKRVVAWQRARRSVKDQYLYYFNKVYQQIVKQGYGRQEREGLTPYLERLNDQLPHELKAFISLYSVYMDERYGEIPIEKTHVLQIMTFAQKMKKMKKPIRKQDIHGRKRELRYNKNKTCNQIYREET